MVDSQTSLASPAIRAHLLLLSWENSHPVDDLGLCEPVVQIMAELLMADKLSVGKSQGEAGKDEEGPR